MKPVSLQETSAPIGKTVSLSKQQ